MWIRIRLVSRQTQPEKRCNLKQQIQTQVSLGLSQNECNEWAEKQHKVEYHKHQRTPPKDRLEKSLYPSLQATKNTLPKTTHPFRVFIICLPICTFLFSGAQCAEDFIIFLIFSHSIHSKLGCPLFSDQAISHILSHMIPSKTCKHLINTHQNPVKSWSYTLW